MLVTSINIVVNIMIWRENDMNPMVVSGWANYRTMHDM